MKKYVWIIIICIMAVGFVSIVACSKDNTPIEAQINSTASPKSANANNDIEIAEWTNNGIVFLFDKDEVLFSLKSQLKDSLGQNCIMEDIRIEIKEVNAEEVPIVCISYFDLDAEESITLYGILRQQASNSTSVMLALGSGEIAGSCVGVNCKEPCNGDVGTTAAGETVVFGCKGCEHATNPAVEKKCDYGVIQGIVSRLVFNSFQMNT